MATGARVPAVDWEQTLRNWSKPSSDTEQQKCDNAVRMICDAIKASAKLQKHEIQVFAQGSYRNNTNVKSESDVDVCVRCMDVFVTDYRMAKNLTDQTVHVVSSDYTYSEFKNDVQQALENHFGASAVRRGPKAFDIHPTSYRVDADVVATVEYRRYYGDPASYDYHSGTRFISDNGDVIINWPIQNYDNGVEKNKKTGGRFKLMTRALKRLRYKMEDEGISAAKNVPSYLIECLMWNVPNYCFGNERYVEDMKSALAHLYVELGDPEKVKEWGEVNELKYLFRSGQPWTREQALAFVSAAWGHLF